ncbi:CWC16 protein, partial [Trinorchestia longiramus]
MSERKVLNKYYPPDFDPSKIPRVKGSKNRQFTVRLMAPCNMKCYTCGEYIAKGKKFNARKEDVDDMNFLGIRIYRFYIRCPGCISEISFRTDPASTDYVLEAGAHRNFQALKLAEEQAAREAKEAQDEIESNPMLLLENRTQQSQYEMDLLETLEDLRDQNDRHAGIDLSAVAGKYQKERELTAEQLEEQERMEAYIALGYEMIEGKLVKRLKDEDLSDESPIKKVKVEGSDFLTEGKPMNPMKHQNSLKAKLNGVVRKKSQASVVTSRVEKEQLTSSISMNNSISIPDPDRIKMPPPSRIRRLVQNISKDSSNSTFYNSA